MDGPELALRQSVGARSTYPALRRRRPGSRHASLQFVSLHGYHECLVRLGKPEPARIVKQQLDVALARADVPIKSSCFCRMTHHAAVAWRAHRTPPLEEADAHASVTLQPRTSTGIRQEPPTRRFPGKQESPGD
jgi:hypothetical protein